LLGWLTIAFMFGNAIGPFLGGYIFDATGSYRLLFILCIGFSLVSSVFISRMRNERLRTNPQ
jgi:MFS family permease